MFLGEVSFLRYIETKKDIFNFLARYLWKLFKAFLNQKCFLYSSALFTVKETWKTIFSFSKQNICFWGVSFFSTFQSRNLVNNFTSLRQKNRLLSRD